MNKFSDKTLCNTDMCFDFDGVIHKHHEWMPCNICIGSPVPEIIAALQNYRRSYTIAIYSVRSAWSEGRQVMKEFIAQHTTPEFADSLEYPDHKPKSKWYFDDRAIRIDGPETLPTKEELESTAIPWHRKETKNEH